MVSVLGGLSDSEARPKSREVREVDVAILGTGPCGLGAAWRLSQQAASAQAAFVIVDQNASPGGSAASTTTPEGFVFDYGGHVLYPHEHYSGFKALLDELVPEWFESVPIRGVWIDGRLVPYPLQRNLHRLPPRKLLVAMLGLLKVRLSEVMRCMRPPGASDLERYLQDTFGRGLTRIALAPLNRKMWAYEPRELGSEWTSQRSGSSAPNVCGARVRETVRSIFTRRDNLGWTAATRVRYPAFGGSGSIWMALAERVRDHRVDGERVVGIDDRRKLIRLAGGARIRYQRLLSTLPLDVLVGLLEDNGAMAAAAGQLRYAQAGFVGFGFHGEPPPVLRSVHSFHVPQPDVPCWRITLPSNFAPGNVPPGKHWSMLCEISARPEVKLDLEASAKTILAKLRAQGLVPASSTVVSRWLAGMKHGYPVPFLGRDALLRQINESLWERGILSRGRFGGWKYEVSNQDHAFMQGVEAVDFLLADRAETTYRLPQAVN